VRHDPPRIVYAGRVWQSTMEVPMPTLPNGVIQMIQVGGDLHHPPERLPIHDGPPPGPGAAEHDVWWWLDGGGRVIKGAQWRGGRWHSLTAATHEGELP
jgi:hypothetical protein